jgi:hypothetical protein
MRSKQQAAALLVPLLLLAACPGFEPPPPYEDGQLRKRAVTQVAENFRVSAAMPTAEEARTIFGIDLAARHIQPVWLEIENGSTRPVLFLITGLDPEYFSPLEVAFAYHRAFSGAGNARLDDHVQALAFPYRAPILPGTTSSGFVFTYESRPSVILDVDLLGRKWSRTVPLIVPVPGADTLARERVELGHTYPASDIVEIADESRLRAALEALPCCASEAPEAVESVPLNLVLVGEVDDWGPAFVRRGYRVSPSHPLYALGRAQDLSGRKFSRWVTAQPHLVRLWLTPLRYLGKPVWIGQVSAVQGGRFAEAEAEAEALRTDPNVDASRNDVVADLIYSQAVSKLGFVAGAGRTAPAQPQSNGSTYRTDGLRAVLILAERRVALSDLDFFDWERLVD